MEIGLLHYMGLSAILFLIGLFGVLTNRHLIRMLMCMELMLNAVNINFLAMNQFINPDGLNGHIFAVFILTVSAAEAALGLAIVIHLYRMNKSVDVTSYETLKG